MGLPIKWLQGEAFESPPMPTDSNNGQGRTRSVFEEQSAILREGTPTNPSDGRGRTRSVFEEHSAILRGVVPFTNGTHENEPQATGAVVADADQFLEDLGEVLGEEHPTMTLPAFPDNEDELVGNALEDTLTPADIVDAPLFVDEKEEFAGLPMLEEMLTPQELANPQRWAEEVEMQNLITRAQTLTGHIDNALARAEANRTDLVAQAQMAMDHIDDARARVEADGTRLITHIDDATARRGADWTRFIERAQMATDRLDDVIARLEADGAQDETPMRGVETPTAPLPNEEEEQNLAMEQWINFDAEQEFRVHRDEEDATGDQEEEDTTFEANPAPDGPAILTEEEQLTDALFNSPHPQPTYGPDFWLHVRTTYLGDLRNIELFIGRILEHNHGPSAARIWGYLHSRGFFFRAEDGEGDAAVQIFEQRWDMAEQARERWLQIADEYAYTDLGRLVSDDYSEHRRQSSAGGAQA